MHIHTLSLKFVQARDYKHWGARHMRPKVPIYCTHHTILNMLLDTKGNMKAICWYVFHEPFLLFSCCETGA